MTFLVPEPRTGDTAGARSRVDRNEALDSGSPRAEVVSTDKPADLKGWPVECIVSSPSMGPAVRVILSSSYPNCQDRTPRA